MELVKDIDERNLNVLATKQDINDLRLSTKQDIGDIRRDMKEYYYQTVIAYRVISWPKLMQR